MIQSDRGWKFLLATRLAVSGALVATSGTCVLAQIEPDNTLGNESSVVKPNANVNGRSVEQIEGGARRGGNLFHSFRSFNVNEGQGVYFSNPAGVENILGRVTGANPSEILGRLGVVGGDANLFLMNPNGIIFGANASLDVNGSFVATTANEIRLGETGRFSATEPQTSNLLTVNPSALFFNSVAAQPIVNQSQVLSLSGETNSVDEPVGLQVSVGKTLALVGGDVFLQGGNLTASEGRIELGSVAGVGEVNLSQKGDNWIFSYSGVDAFKNILVERTVIDVSGEGGGSLQIQGAQLEVKGSGIFADTWGSKNGGEVLLHTTEKIIASNESYISTDVLGLTTRTGGNLTLETEQLTVRSGAAVSSSLFGEGRSGNLTVKARESVEVIGRSVNGLSPSGLATNIDSKAIGSTGNLNIETKRLTVRGGAVVSNSLFGQGKSGNLIVKARESVEVGESTDGKFISGLFTQVEQGAVGNTGNLSIDTERLTVKGGAQVSSRIFGQGRSGDLTVKARESVEIIGRLVNDLSGSGLFTNVQLGAIGDAGNLSIDTERLTVRDGAQISSGVFGQGTAGNLTVKARESVKIIGTSVDGRIPSGLFTSVESDTISNAGNLIIETGRLIILDGANVRTTTSGEGLTGDLMVKASESVEVIGESINDRGFSILSTSAESGTINNSGNLSIETGRLIIRDGAQVQSATFDRGSAGNLTIKATDSVQVIGTSTNGQKPSRLSARTTANGNAGDLTLKTRQFIIEDGGQVTSNSTGTGTAGNINLQANSISLEGKGSSILADTTSTDGGNITLQVNDRLLLRNGSQISTTAGTNQAGGNGGNITIDTPFLIAIPQENSDITADAFEGRGGRIEIINTQGIFGIEERDRDTEFSDITASSELGLQGTVEIDNPNIDPSRTLVNLPVQPVETQVVQACQPGTNQFQSEFVVTGRGGLPPSPQEEIDINSTGIDWVSLNPNVAPESKPEQTQENLPNSSSVEANDITTSKPIVEAQGMVVESNGKVILTAQTSTNTPNNSWLLPHSCKGS